MTSSGSGGASLETSADSSYHHPLNFSFSNSTTTTSNNNNQFMTSSFSDLLTSGNDIYTGGSNSSYQNIDNIVNRFTDRLPSDRIGGGSGNGIPKFKSITPPSLPISPPSVSPSSYFSIPPGLSPAQLLDSPVLLSASNILPSPTTGTYSAHQSYNWRGNSGDFQQQNIKQEDRNYSDFSFQPQPRPLVSIFHQEQQQPWTISQESTTTIGTDFSSSGGNPNVKSEFPRVLHSFSPEISTIQHQANNNQISNNQQQSDYNHPYNSQASQTLREKRRSEDGYNWRKYGQKQVKGSQNPRSYYKCTYPNCPTKKKVERSLDGHITEIVYKGTHNHPKPQSTRRSSSGNNSTQAAAAALASSAVAIPTSSDISDHHLKITTNQMEHVTTPENSSVSIGDEEFDQSSQRSKSGGDEFDEDEKDPKRWKGEIDQNEGTSAVGSRTVREPRVVVQTTSDIDILDDGYRWRKYGQKVVKGNPNPRSYYKCTSSGCAVRKHVERASHDLRAVITTYEGKHNHDVPAARGSGSINRPALPTTLDNNNRHVTMNSTVVRPYPSSVSSIQSNNGNGNGNVRQPVSEGQTPFTLEMLRSPGSFGFSGFNNPLESSFMNQQQQSENVYSKTKEEPREDMLLESILY